MTTYNKILLKNISYVDENFEIKNSQILIEGEKISKIFDSSQELNKHCLNTCISIDLDGYIAFPGLINSHDHLIESFVTNSIFELYKTKFQTWYEWEQYFKESINFKLYQSLSAADLYSLGMYRNVLSGVTLIVDHSPREIRVAFSNKPLVSLLEHFFLAHSVSSCAPKWGLGIAEEYQLSQGVIPFVIHAAEGLKPECKEEIETLARLGVLGNNTVLINPIGISENEINQISIKGASIVWCPSCCNNIYGVHPKIYDIINNGIRLCIGSDKAQVNPRFLLDDIKIAFDILSNLLSNWQKNDIIINLLKMVTSIPAKIYNISNEYGIIKENYYANLLIVENFNNKNFELMLTIDPSQISLLFHKGTLVYGDEKFRLAITREIGNYSEIYIDKKPKIIFGRPLQTLQRIKDKLDYEVSIPYLSITTLENVLL